MNHGKYTSSTKPNQKAMTDLYERITNPELLVRRVTVTASHVIKEEDIQRQDETPEQFDLFMNAIDEKLRLLHAHIKEPPEVTVTYFQPDEKKNGGANVIVKGSAKKVKIVSVEGILQILAVLK